MPAHRPKPTRFSSHRASSAPFEDVGFRNHVVDKGIRSRRGLSRPRPAASFDERHVHRAAPGSVIDFDGPARPVYARGTSLHQSARHVDGMRPEFALPLDQSAGQIEDGIPTIRRMEAVTPCRHSSFPELSTSPHIGFRPPGLESIDPRRNRLSVHVVFSNSDAGASASTALCMRVDDAPHPPISGAGVL